MRQHKKSQQTITTPQKADFTFVVVASELTNKNQEIGGFCFWLVCNGEKKQGDLQNKFRHCKNSPRMHVQFSFHCSRRKIVELDKI